MWSSDLMRSSFLLQAEEGIRDATVTGVQTCALPISARLRATESPRLAPSPEALQANRGRWRRSEERRVGKEGRSRGWPHHLKKKKKQEENHGSGSRGAAQMTTNRADTART